MLMPAAAMQEMARARAPEDPDEAHPTGGHHAQRHRDGGAEAGDERAGEHGAHDGAHDEKTGRRPNDSVHLCDLQCGAEKFPR